MSVCEKGHTVLPKELAELADLPGNRFIGIKVDRGLDWVTALGGSTIKVSEDDIIFKPPAASPDLTAKISDSDWCQLLCLAPKQQGDHRLFCWGAVQVTLQVTKSTTALRRAEAAAQKTEATLDKLRLVGETAAAKQRRAEAKRRIENREKFNLSPLRTALLGVGWPMSNELEPVLEEDAWNGIGKKPTHLAAETQSKAARAVAKLQGLGTVKIRALPSSGNDIVPVAFWSMGHFPPEDCNQLTFKRLLVGTKRKKCQLSGRDLRAPDLKLTGMPAAPDPNFGQVTLIGVVPPGSKELLLFQGDVYKLKADIIPQEVGEVPGADQDGYQDASMPTTSKGYRDKRKVAIEGFGAAKKMRSFNGAVERLDRDCEVLEFEQMKEDMEAKTKAKNENQLSREQKDEQRKREILPEFQKDAPDAKSVYEKSLASIVTEDAMLQESAIFSEELVEFVKTSKDQLPNLPVADILRVCQNHLVVAVLKARAYQGAKLPKDIQTFARKLGVLAMLVKLYIHGNSRGRGKATEKGVVNLLGFQRASPLTAQLHSYCYDAMPVSKNLRIFNSRKTFCVMMLWALYLTPELWIDVDTSIEMELTTQRTEILRICDMMGCVSEEKKAADGGRPSTRIKLSGPPKFNKRLYEVQSKMPSQKKKR
eukprot:TRINITY_DN7207_c0_g1_i1.p1 TRINITY_DN7207_c0_g1~~TRINITY_DN7207_c0_g1_i1.p1  ORF type:complete len:650 (-),score=127.08 TRINITY_DN7207_c0_g1_i1:54-2003(-)